MTLPYKTTSKNIYNTQNLRVSVNFNQRQTRLLMCFKDTPLHTNDLPFTNKILGKHLPSIFKCKCYNNYNLSFRQEAQNTEIAHLFEHILLEYLCQNKIKQGAVSAAFKGVTEWNWTENERGTFEVEISCGYKDIYNFEDAFGKAIYLLDLILKDKEVLHSDNINYESGVLPA